MNGIIHGLDLFLKEKFFLTLLLSNANDYSLQELSCLPACRHAKGQQKQISGRTRAEMAQTMTNSEVHEKS